MNWYEGVLDALRCQISTARPSVRHAIFISPRLFGMTEKELDSYHDAQRLELDRLTVLSLVASVEAEIRLDYDRRVHTRQKDPLSRAYRTWRKTLNHRKRRRPDFDESGLLAVMKQSGTIDPHRIGQFRECLPPRHWVGHGRYFTKPIQMEKLDPHEVCRRGHQLLSSIHQSH